MAWRLPDWSVPDKNTLWFFVSSGRNGKRCKTWTFSLSGDFDDFTDCRFHRSRRYIFERTQTQFSIVRIIVIDSLAFFIRHEGRSDWWRISILYHCYILFRLDSYTWKHKSFYEMKKDVAGSFLPSRDVFTLFRLSKWVCLFWIILLLLENSFSFINICINRNYWSVIYKLSFVFYVEKFYI